jgi:hypothetical protein
MEMHVFKMASNFREKKTSITTMGVKSQAFAIFPTPLVSHYPLPLRVKVLSYANVQHCSVFNAYMTTYNYLFLNISWTLTREALNGRRGI